MNIEIKDGQVYLDRTVETQSSINEVRQRLSSIRHRVHNRLLWLGYYKHGQAGKRGSISKRRVDMPARECKICHSNTTNVDKANKPKWYRKDGAHICHKCYMRTKLNPKWHRITNPIWNANRLRFKGKEVAIDYNPRVGVCNWCRAVVGIDCSRTDMHHEKYDPSNPTAHTIELCIYCHNRETNRARYEPKV